MRNEIIDFINDEDYTIINERYSENTEEEGTFIKAYRDILIDLSNLDYTDEQLIAIQSIKSICNLKDTDGIEWDYDISYITKAKNKIKEVV